MVKVQTSTGGAISAIRIPYSRLNCWYDLIRKGCYVGRVAPITPLLKEIGKRPSLFLKFFSPDPPHEEGSERIYSLPWQPVLETSHIRVVKRALVNNRNQENEIKKVSSTPHLLIATEISELRPVLPFDRRSK